MESTGVGPSLKQILVCMKWSFDSRTDGFIASKRKHELFRRSRDSSTNPQHILISGNAVVENRYNYAAI